MSSSESDAPSDWEAESIASDDEGLTPQTATQNKSSPNKQTATDEFKLPAHLQKSLANPDDERERIKMIQELRDISLGGDMFGVSADDISQDFHERSRNLLAKVIASGGVDASGSRGRKTNEDPLQALSVKKIQDVDALLAALCPKITDSAVKSQTWLRFMDRLLSVVSAKMDPPDLKTLEKKVNIAQKVRIQALNEAAQKSKKGSDLNPNIRDPTGELDIYDGVDDNSDNEYDDYM